MKKSNNWKIASELVAVIVFAFVTYDAATRWIANKEKKIFLIGAICIGILTIMRAVDLWVLITKMNKPNIEN